MSEAIITVENLSKKYLVGHKTGGPGSYRYTALRDVVEREVRNIARKTIDIVRGRQVVQGHAVEEFWALKTSASRSSAAKYWASSAATAPARARCSRS